MEPVGLVASVVTLVAVIDKTVEGVRRTTRLWKDAPTEIRELVVSTVGHLLRYSVSQTEPDDYVRRTFWTTYKRFSNPLKNAPMEKWINPYRFLWLKSRAAPKNFAESS